MRITKIAFALGFTLLSVISFGSIQKLDTLKTAVPSATEALLDDPVCGFSEAESALPSPMADLSVSPGEADVCEAPKSALVIDTCQGTADWHCWDFLVCCN